MSDPWNLTPRERQTLTLLAEHGTGKIAARVMGISYRTLEKYVERAGEKMGEPHRLRMVVLWDRFARTAQT